MPSANYVAAQFDYRAPATESGGLVFSANSTNDHWRGAITNGSGTTSRSSQFAVDGVDVGSLTRDQLHTLLHNGDWHTIRVKIWGQTNVENGTSPFALGVLLTFGTYLPQASFCAAADVRNFKVKLGAQASPTDWDYESELGDTNGFSQNNVTVVIEGNSALANMIQQHAAMGYL
jgi:hypothetical protein